MAVVALSWIGIAVSGDRRRSVISELQPTGRLRDMLHSHHNGTWEVVCNDHTQPVIMALGKSSYHCGGLIQHDDGDTRRGRVVCVRRRW
jgi:hypothetical protein